MVKFTMEPGETPILRLPSLWGLWLLVMMAVLGLLDLSLSAHGLATGSGDFVRHIAHTAVGFMMVALGIYMGRGLAAWQILVTDRHLLLRRWRELGRYDALAPDDIEHAEYDRKHGRFILHCGDRTLFLTCTKWSAGRILKALGRDEARAC